MATGTLYTYPENFRAYKAQIAAQYSGAKVKVVSQAPEFKFGETNKTDAFLKKFPTGKVPAYENSDGVTLFEANAIAHYVADEKLRGASALDSAYVRQWMDFADNEILPASCNWVFPCLGAMQFNKQNTEAAKEAIKCALSVLNKHLETRTFLVGERISLADIAVCCNLLQLYTHVLEPAFRAAYQNTNRWFMTLVNQPEFKTVIGEFKLCEKMAQFDSKKYQELHGGNKKDVKKDKKPAPAPQKKEPKKEEPVAEEPPKVTKPKDPFALMPAGSFVWDDWKKMYSNNPAATAMEYFFENFDAENNSVWFCDYSYASELSLLFMTANLVEGMFQRLDRMRKYSFGCMKVLGENRNNTIKGVWIWRGKGLAFDQSEDLQVDSPSYKWTKLEWGTDETKNLITTYFTKFSGQIDGQDIAEASEFK
jgi:elongation factor 1-gamma